MNRAISLRAWWPVYWNGLLGIALLPIGITSNNVALAAMGGFSLGTALVMGAVNWGDRR